MSDLLFDDDFMEDDNTPYFTNLVSIDWGFDSEGVFRPYEELEEMGDLDTPQMSDPFTNYWDEYNDTSSYLD